jgi:hypothetical protein
VRQIDELTGRLRAAIEEMLSQTEPAEVEADVPAPVS